MKRHWSANTPRALARGLQICTLTACLVAGAGLSRYVAHAGAPKPVITVALVATLPTPPHLHILGSHFAPSSSVVVQVTYPGPSIMHQTTTATTSGAIAVDIPFGPMCGTVTDKVIAYSLVPKKVSNVVMQSFSFRPCGTSGPTPALAPMTPSLPDNPPPAPPT